MTFFKTYKYITLNIRQFKLMYSREQLFTISKPKWEWQKVNSELRTKVDGKMTSLPLKPQITFEDRNQEGKTTKLKLKISVDTEKSLQYENQVGWNWHKSSNLPAISLKAEIRHPETEALFPLPENLQARIFAVKIVVNNLERQIISHIDDVGLRGPCQVHLKDGCGVFNGIRFQTTSYNNEGVKFYLLIAIFLNDQSSQQLSNVVCSIMSPPIFVDSRKSARDYQQKRFLSFVEIFDPFLMKKQFSKKSIREKSDFQIKIQNSMDGLYNYLTAPNIRHKVKHPFFLCVKFSNVFRIMINQKCHQVKEQITPMNNFLLNFQKNLVKQIGKNKKNSKPYGKFGKPFLISVSGQCNNQKKSKIYQCLQFLNCKTIEFAKYGYQIGPNFKNILQLGDIIKGYNQVYECLIQQTQKQIQSRKKKGDFVGDEASCRQSQADNCNLRKSGEENNKQQSIIQKQDLNIEEQNYLSKRQVEPNRIQKVGVRHVVNIKQQIISQNARQDALKTRDFQERQAIEQQQQNQQNKFKFKPNQKIYQTQQNIQLNRIPDYFGYYESLVYQIDIQNAMLQMILQQNLAMRERLIALTMLPQHQIMSNLNFQASSLLNRNNFYSQEQDNLSIMNHLPYDLNGLFKNETNVGKYNGNIFRAKQFNYKIEDLNH